MWAGGFWSTGCWPPRARKLPRQVDTPKRDSPADEGLGRNVSGGTRPADRPPGTPDRRRPADHRHNRGLLPGVQTLWRLRTLCKLLLRKVSPFMSHLSSFAFPGSYQPSAKTDNAAAPATSLSRVSQGVSHSGTPSHSPAASGPRVRGPQPSGDGARQRSVSAAVQDDARKETVRRVSSFTGDLSVGRVGSRVGHRRRSSHLSCLAGSRPSTQRR